MDLPTLDALLSPAGAAALVAADALRPTTATYPACFDRLARTTPGPLARAALDTVLLRQKAAGKLAGAERLFLDREALEMASGDLTAAYRAARFTPFGRVADLGCGVGADALALAAAGLDLVCVDRDPVRLRMCEANLRAVGHAAEFVRDDLRTVPLDGCRAAFCDPGRRPGGGRVTAPDSYEPPVAAVAARFPADFPLGVKAAPGVARADLRAFAADPEFVSADGELKECVLWFGAFRTGRPVATVLPGPYSLTGEAGDPYDVGPLGPVAVLYDPDPAVVRADLMNELATRLGAWPIEPGYALLAAAGATPTPFATAYRVEEVLPLDGRTVGGWLRQRGVGRVTVLKRGVDVDADALGKRWRTPADGHRVVVLARAGGKRVAVVAEPVGAGG